MRWTLRNEKPGLEKEMKNFSEIELRKLSNHSPQIMFFVNVEPSSTFTSEFSDFIYLLIDRESLRYGGGWLEAIKEIRKNIESHYNDFADELIDKIMLYSSDMLGTHRKEKKDWIEYIFDFNFHSFKITIYAFSSTSIPEEVELTKFRFEKK